ncbi:unnamed protein product, partial [Pelagomonas calceolata]
QPRPAGPHRRERSSLRTLRHDSLSLRRLGDDASFHRFPVVRALLRAQALLPPKPAARRFFVQSAPTALAGGVLWRPCRPARSQCHLFGVVYAGRGCRLKASAVRH